MRLIRNEKVCWQVYFQQETRKGNFRQEKYDIETSKEWIVIDNGVPAIIDQQTFGIVQFKAEDVTIGLPS